MQYRGGFCIQRHILGQILCLTEKFKKALEYNGDTFHRFVGCILYNRKETLGLVKLLLDTSEMEQYRKLGYLTED